MKIAKYLKDCRTRLNMTQEEFSYELYLFNNERFRGIDTTTISKWERGVTSPPIPRLQALIHFFQYKSSLPLPCWENFNEEKILENLYSKPVKKILGSAKEIVGRVPLDIELQKDYNLIPLHSHFRAKDLLELTLLMIQSIKPTFKALEIKELERWMEDSRNFFQVVSYKNSFLGMLSILRLKPKVFDEIMNFQREEGTLKVEDFANLDKEGSLFFLSFYSLTPEIATLLMARLYAHLIANQQNIKELGFISSLAEAHRIGENMRLDFFKRRGNLSAYRNNLFTILSSEPVIKTLFEKG